MLPMKAVRLQLGNLLAADTTTIAPATANKIALIAAPFNPGDENLVIGNLTLATFTGSTPKSGVDDDQQVGIDPATQEQVITILQPAGGFRFECSAAPASPETIYGFALVDDTLAVLLGVQALPEPVAIENVGDFVDTGAVELRFVAQPMS